MKLRSDTLLTENAINLLTCQNSGRKLKFSDDRLSLIDSESQFKYPIIDGIPWLFKDSGAVLWQWSLNVQSQILKYREEEDHFKETLKKDGLSLLAKKRLKLIKDAKMHDRRVLSDLLRPLMSLKETSVDFARVMASRLPLSQSLTGYYSNIHRDWSWSATGLIDPFQDENQVSLKMVLKVLSAAGVELDSKQNAQNEIVQAGVFGAGACRLAYDLHQSSTSMKTLALDINPLLFAVAKQVMLGNSLELYEYPVAPQHLKNHAVMRNLMAPARVRPGFVFVHGDALNPPVKSGALDLLLTPWFIDIVPASPRVVLARLNSCLRMGGFWLNFGTCVFHTPEVSERLSYEELLETVNQAGFQMMAQDEARIPYMASPSSAHARLENVSCFVAKKVREVDAPEEHYVAPRWARMTSESVPLSKEMMTFFNEHRTYAQIASLVDGKRSVDDIAQIISEMFSIQFLEAKESFLKIALTLHETSAKTNH